MKSKLIFAGLALIMIASLLPASTLAAQGDAKVETRKGNFYLVTPYLTVRLSDKKPDMMFWSTNDSSENNAKKPMFHVGFTHIAEVFDEDLIIESRSDIDGKTYSLASMDWSLATENYTNELRATLTSEPLANEATIEFVFHVYTEDKTVTQELNDTTVTYDVEALSEIKFDIIVNNWVFTEDATGLTFIMDVHELGYRHRVRTGNRTNNPEEEKYNNQTEEARENREHDPSKWGIEFADDDGDVQSYFAWTPEADIFDSEDNYLDTVNVTSTVASQGMGNSHHKGNSFGVDFVHLYLTYPNYGDGVKLVHDPVIAINENYTSGLSWTITSMIVLPIMVTAYILYRRKRNQN